MAIAFKDQTCKGNQSTGIVIFIKHCIRHSGKKSIYNSQFNSPNKHKLLFILLQRWQKGAYDPIR